MYCHRSKYKCLYGLHCTTDWYYAIFKDASTDTETNAYFQISSNYNLRAQVVLNLLAQFFTDSAFYAAVTLPVTHSFTSIYSTLLNKLTYSNFWFYFVDLVILLQFTTTTITISTTLCVVFIHSQPNTTIW